MSCQGNIEVRSFGSGARRKLTENRSWGLLLVPFQISSAIFGADRNITELCWDILHSILRNIARYLEKQHKKFQDSISKKR